jgi:hypothetical protein
MGDWKALALAKFYSLIKIGPEDQTHCSEAPRTAPAVFDVGVIESTCLNASRYSIEVKL